MKTANLIKNATFGEVRPAISVLFETETTKEIRILMKKGQEMKEHQTPYPITVELFEGAVNFGVQGEKHLIGKGDLLSLQGGVPHDLVAIEDSIIRLTLSKLDKVERVVNVSKQ
ncbi:MAG: cupin domain-containing protein [Flavobacteriaceae bacterium]|nr:cupin domain-containing protein [Flavobacteriaceae bacterium]